MWETGREMGVQVQRERKPREEKFVLVIAGDMCKDGNLQRTEQEKKLPTLPEKMHLRKCSKVA